MGLLNGQRTLKGLLLHSVWGLAALSLALLVLTRELDALSATASFTVVPLLYYFERKDRLIRLRWLETALVLGLFGLLSALFLWTKMSFLIMVADFLVGFLIIKLGFKKERQDFQQIIALSFFILLSASTLALDFTYLFTFLLFALAAAWTLSLYVLSEGEPETAPVPMGMTTALIRSGQATVLLVTAFAAGIFIFFPRLSLAVFQGGALLGPTARSGISDRMNLVQAGKIFEDPSVALRVEMSPQDRVRMGPAVYLRGQSLTAFNGVEWTNPVRAGKSDVQDSYRSRVLNIQRVGRNHFQVLAPRARGWAQEYGLRLDDKSYVRQKVYLESVDSALIFAAPWLESVEARLPEVTLYPDHSVSRPARYSGRIFYQARSLVERPNARVLESISLRSMDPTGENQGALELPGHLDFSQAKALAARLVSKSDSPYAQARKIETALKSNYHYSLTIQSSGGSNPVEEFLFKTRSGHCEYFASAMVVLLRLRGIPARVATGFLLTEWNDNGGYYVGRSKDAHSWVEVNLGGFWMEFDPTPRANDAALEARSPWDRAREKLDYWNFLWNAYVLGYDLESQKQLARTIELKSNRLSVSLDRRIHEWKIRHVQKQSDRLRGWIRRWSNSRKTSGLTAEPTFDWIEKGGGITLLLVLSAIGVGLIFLILINYIKFTKNTLNKSFYIDILSILSNKKRPKNASETPREFLQRMRAEALDEPGSEALAELTRMHDKCTYAGNPLSHEDKATIARAVKVLKTSLRHP